VDWEDNNPQIRILKKSPTHSTDIEDYPIFRAGIPFSKKKKLFISGEERSNLKDEKQINKWDYFFRASEEELIQQHLYMINELEESAEKYQEKMIEHLVKIGGVFIGAIILSFVVWGLIGFAAFFYGLYHFRDDIMAAYKAYDIISILKNFASKITEEKKLLENQIVQTNISGGQIEKWFDEEIFQLDESVATEFSLPQDQIKRLKWKDIGDDRLYDENGITGLIVKEWGYFQPFETNGKKTIIRKHWYHLHGLRFHKNKPLVGVYYLTFIYLTSKTLAVSSFFYDFILSRRFGQTTNQYYYKDIVSIGTAITETKMSSEADELETEQVIISFYNSEKISITLTDKVAIENLRERIDERRNAENNDEELGGDIDSLELGSIDNPEMDQLFEMEDHLPGTRVKAIVKTVKQFWNERKDER